MQMTTLFQLISLFFCFSLGAALEDHFKPALNKSENHSLQNIDFIYMINLDQRPEKFAKSCAQLHPYGIFPYRFSAVNGWELSLEAINDVGVKYATGMKRMMATSFLHESMTPNYEIMETCGRTYFAHGISFGAIGIVLSHLSILQDAFDAGYETIWVMEDDIEVRQDPRVLSDLIVKLDEQVGENWDILFTDRDTKDRNGNYVFAHGFAVRPNFSPERRNQYDVKQTISADFRKIGARFGAYSMILRRSGIEKILHFIKTHQIFLPYDHVFYFHLRQQMPGPQAYLAFLIKCRREKRQAEDMVEMRVREQDIHLCVAAMLAERVDARAGVEDDELTPRPYLHARRIAAVMALRGRGDRHGPAYAPEGDFQVLHRQLQG